MDNIKKTTSTYSQNQSALVFWHRCSSTDLMIDFANLTWAVGDISSYGVQNPPAWVIINSNLGSLKSYLKITTSANRNILPDYFDLYNSKMVFKNGFTPLEGEVFKFEVLNANRPLNSLEAQPIYRTGLILANTNQFDFVDEISVPTQEARCPIQVLVDDSPVYMTGDWTFVPQSGDSSKSRKIQMVNTVDYDRQILVTGYCVYQPNGSVTQQVETIAGQLDKVITDLAQLTNKDITEYQVVPNNIDLAAFGNTVSSILNASISVPVNHYIDASNNGAQVLTANVTDIPFILTSQFGLNWDGSGLVASVTGIYNISGSIYVTTSQITNIDIFVNGVTARRVSTGSAASNVICFAGQIRLIAGQRMSVRVNQTITLIQTTTSNWISVSLVNASENKTIRQLAGL